MKHLLAAALLASLAFRPSVAAQAKPDFSGTWIMDASSSQSPVQNEPVKSITHVIKQSPSEIVIETTRDERQQKVSYRLGSPDAATSSGGRTGLLASTFYWQGDTLVTETFSDVNGMTVRTRATHALQAGGAEMTVETLLVVEHGYTIRGGQNYGAVKDLFKRVRP